MISPVCQSQSPKLTVQREGTEQSYGNQLGTGEGEKTHQRAKYGLPRRPLVQPVFTLSSAVAPSLLRDDVTLQERGRVLRKEGDKEAVQLREAR